MRQFLLDPADCRHPDEVLRYQAEWPADMDLPNPSMHQCTACGTNVQRPVSVRGQARISAAEFHARKNAAVAS